MTDVTHDAVGAQILGNRLHSIANEVELTLIRAAYSAVIKESFDCSAAILGADFEFWGQADAIPLQMGVLSDVARNVSERVLGGPSALAPGSIVLTNDPSVGAPHLNDFIALAPVHARGDLVAYVATIAHFTDVGGKVPGSMPADSTDLFQEGFRLPPTTICRDGVLEQRVLEILLANTRTPENLEADLRAEIAACNIGVERLAALIAAHGVDGLRSQVASFLDHSERLARIRIGQLRPGTYRSSRMIDNQDPADLGDCAQVTADVLVGPDGVAVDFSASSAQLARPLNVVPSNGYAAGICALRNVLGPGVVFNGGVQRLFTVRSDPGSLMNPISPAPVAARAAVAALAYQCVLDGLSQASDQGAVASSSGGTTMPFVWAPIPGPGEAQTIMVDNSLTGGSGARKGRPGQDAVENAVTNAVNLPVEMLEQEFPVRVERYEVRNASGGLGQWAGGDGMRRVVTFLRPGVLSVRGHGMQHPPTGQAGGDAGAPSRFRVVRGDEVLELPGQLSGFSTQSGDVFVAETPGGGGYGVPPDAVADHPSCTRADGRDDIPAAER